MKKLTLAEQVENILALIKQGHYGARQLCNLFRNVGANKELDDAQRESLVEAIEIQLWKDYSREAQRLFGARNRKTRSKLENYFTSLQERFDLSANHHKNKVKVGGNVIAGDAKIFDYISYRNNDTRRIAFLAFRKIGEDMPLDIAVGKYVVGENDVMDPSFRTFIPAKFDAATELFENYLTSVLAGDII